MKLSVVPTCAGSVRRREAAAESERTQLCSLVSFLSTVWCSLISLYPSIPCLYLSFQVSLLLSSLSHCHVALLSLSLAPTRFLLPLHLFSPPTFPCMERQLTASLLSSTVLPFSPSFFLFFSGCVNSETSVLTRKSVPHWPLLTHSALCIYLPLFFSAHGRTSEVYSCWIMAVN